MDRPGLRQGIWANAPPYKRTQSARIKEYLNKGVPVDTVGAPRVFHGVLLGAAESKSSHCQSGTQKHIEKKLSCDMNI